MKIEGGDGGAVERKKPPKRKRLELCYTPTPQEKEAKIVGFRQEIDSLVKYCKKLVSENREAVLGSFENLLDHSASLNGVIACLMEESDLPLSKLVDEIFEKVKGNSGNGNSFSKANVKNGVLMIGQRLCYGVVGAEADVLEDEDDSALWCWETRDLKLIPKSAHASLKALRTFRSKIQERITAVFAMINALEKLDNLLNCHHELTKASEKLGRVLNEADIRLSMEKMLHKNGAEMAEKEAKRGEKLLFKQMEKSQREKDRELNKIVQELRKERSQNKRLKGQEETAEKDQRWREKEEAESRKQLALQQKRQKREEETAEKDRRRREKEEAESRKLISLQKQASLMERFLKRNKTSSSLETDSSVNKAISVSILGRHSESVTLSMDTVFAQNNGIEVEDIRKSHLNAWRSNRYSKHQKKHWGVRRKPKTELFKELKLSTNREQTFHEDPDVEKLVVGFDEADEDRRLSQLNMDSPPHQCGAKRVPIKLLQFDKSHRPAFYGVWPKNSQVVGPRHPFVKDPNIKYEIDSDEEWTEDEPGESLSDIDKDDEDESMVEEDESQDGFFVPDGYLSENEGVKVDEMEDEELDSKVQNVPTSEQSDELYTNLLRQQKYLNSLTEHALKKNKPLIVLNLMHEKSAVSSAEEATGRLKLERLALQTLGMCPLPCFPNIEISVTRLL